MEKLNKKMEYRRVRWSEQSEQNLEKLLRKAWEALPKHMDRNVMKGSGGEQATIGMRSKDKNGLGFAIHCGRYKDKQSASIISMKSQPEVEIDELPPGEEKNFLSSDFAALVKENDVITISAGKGASHLRNFLAGLFKNADIDEQHLSFELVRVPPPNILDKIRRVGVKKLKLNASIREATRSRLEDGGGILSRGIPQFLRATLTHQKADEYGKSTLSIGIDAKKGKVEFKEEALKSMIDGTEVEDFSFLLNDDTEIKTSEMIIKESVNLNRVGQSFEFSQAAEKMASYMEELKDMGYVEV